jgi:spore coat protein U-like protein
MNTTLRLLGLVAAMLATRQATAVPTCTIASGAVLPFGRVVPLASTGDIDTNSGSSFWINCTADVTSAPAIYSGTSRVMAFGENSLPFQLGAQHAGGPELPSTSPGTPLDITPNGSNQTVPLYGRILAADFKRLPAGAYSQVLSVTVEY